MKRILIAGLAAAALLAGPALAAEKAGQWYIAPMASVIWVDEDRLTDDDLGAAISIGRALTEDVNVEFHAFGYQMDGINETDYWGLGADAMRVLYRNQRISPYLLGGVGWNKSNRASGRDGEDLYANVAVGLLTDLGPNGPIALRTELRYRLDTEKRNGDYRDLMLKVGVHLPFGSPYAEPEPVAAAVPPPPPPPPPPAPAPAPAPEPEVVPEVIVLEGVTFAFNSAEIVADEQGTLEEAVATLERNPELEVEVAGHTDSVGNPRYNQGLSERRALSVMEFLVDAGIDPDRLSARGYGQLEPVATNATDQGRAMNRRVELRVKD